MAELERTKDRLDNIRSVEPIISALRTISAAGWRQSSARLEAMRLYREHLSAVLGTCVARVPEGAMAKWRIVARATPSRPAMLVIASDRGLCGAYNDTVLEGAERLISQQRVRSDQVYLATLGKRAARFFQGRHESILFEESLSVTRVASMGLALEIRDRFLDLYDDGSIDGVYIVYSPYRAGVTMPPVSRLWLPIEASSLPGASGEWPEPIIEGDAGALFERAILDWSTVSLYGNVIEAIASEQSARYRAMENASTNLVKMIEELTLAYNTARQYEITMEILDLMSGANVSRESDEH